MSKSISQDISSQITKNTENANDLLTKYDKELTDFINKNPGYTTNLLKKINLSLNNLDDLSNIPNIQAKLKNILKIDSVKQNLNLDVFKNILIQIKNLFKIIDNKEAETRLKKLEDEEKAKEGQVADAKEDSTDTEDIAIEFISSFEEKLKEMEAKLPPKLGVLEQTYANDRVNDKEFCYKFLYCWLNNRENQTNEDVKAVYNNIIDAYDIQNIEKQDTNSIVLDSYNITFDVGFIINIETQVITEKGGAISTQKRRPNKPNKRNHTIKDRVRVKTR